MWGAFIFHMRHDLPQIFHDNSTPGEPIMATTYRTAQNKAKPAPGMVICVLHRIMGAGSCSQPVNIDRITRSGQEKGKAITLVDFRSRAPKRGDSWSVGAGVQELWFWHRKKVNCKGQSSIVVVNSPDSRLSWKRPAARTWKSPWREPGDFSIRMKITEV